MMCATIEPLTQTLLLGKGHTEPHVHLLANKANRHGFIAGATGTGKTITLKILTEQFSALGVPVILTDVKGDLSGCAAAGREHPKITERLDAIGIPNFSFKKYPVTFWDVYGQHGHPMRTTVSEMGPLLLARLLQLNETQESILLTLFKIADDEGYLLIDLPDLKAMLQLLDEEDDTFQREYGKMATGSLQAILRKITALESQGADQFFGEPAIRLFDFIKTDHTGKGVINLIESRELFNQPRLYATVLLWLLSELFESLPEMGDPEKPRLVLFFDEAHLLFDDLPSAVLDKLRQVVRLIRSKGVSVFFVTQNPADLDNEVLGQLGNRIQHALRIVTPKDRKGLKAMVDGFPESPDLDLDQVIPSLKVGEAVVSVLDEDGKPTVPQQTLMVPPESSMKPVTDGERTSLIQQSMFYGQYDERIDRESAHELIEKRLDAREQALLEAAEEKATTKQAKKEEKAKSRKSNRQTPVEAMMKSVMRSVGSQIGRQIARGILGSIKF